MSFMDLIFGGSTSPADKRAIGCPKCGETRYRLQDHEVLGRSPMPGRKVVERETTCEGCGATGTVKVQVRA